MSTSGIGSFSNSTLQQQLQQSDPAQYASVTKQIATNLQSAASTAQSQGNSTVASQLNQLAGDFTTASQTGQLPNLQDLSQAVTGSSGGGHHHHHPSPPSPITTITIGEASTPVLWLLPIRHRVRQPVLRARLWANSCPPFRQTRAVRAHR